MYIPMTSERRKPCSSAFSIDSIISSKTSPTSHQHQQQQPLRHHRSETSDSQKVRVESGRDEFPLTPGDLFPTPPVPPSPTPMATDLFLLNRLPPASSFFQHNSRSLYPYAGLHSLHQENAHQRNNIPTYFASSHIPVSMEMQNEHISLGQNLVDPFYAWLAASATGPHQLSATDGDMFYPFRKAKRIRTAFSPSQLVDLEEAFDRNRYIVGHERKRLAADLQLTETQVKVWFQNRRTKTRRSDPTTTTTSTTTTTTKTTTTSDHQNPERDEDSKDKQRQSNNVHHHRSRRHHHSDDRQAMSSSSASSDDDFVAVDSSDDDANSTDYHDVQRNSSSVRQAS